MPMAVTPVITHWPPQPSGSLCQLCVRVASLSCSHPHEKVHVDGCEKQSQCDETSRNIFHRSPSSSLACHLTNVPVDNGNGNGDTFYDKMSVSCEPPSFLPNETYVPKCDHLATCNFRTCNILVTKSSTSSCNNSYKHNTLREAKRHIAQVTRYLHKLAAVIFQVLLMLLLLSLNTHDHLVEGAVALADSNVPCSFPSEWTGFWFQKGSGPDPIQITASEISEKGTCKDISGDKYLVENRAERCVRCMVINQKHSNVLQYKESFCFTGRARSLREVCAEMNGDASLYSLFRVNTPPVPCPFTGPFKFTYSRGNGECREPVSTVETCTDDKHLLFRFQACADISGSESRVEQLSCLGEWKEGSLRYLIGRVTHPAAKSDEDIFRCFVLEKNKKSNDSYNLAQSGDATCDGLSSAIEGSRTFKLTKIPSVTASCSFPKWLSGPRHWKTLDGGKILDFSKNTSFIVYDFESAHKLRIATCVRQLEPSSASTQRNYQPSHSSRSSSSFSSSSSSSSSHLTSDSHTSVSSPSSPFVEYVIHSVAGCKVGYMCIRIHKRNNHVIEIESGSQMMVKDNMDPSVCSTSVYSTFLTITTFNPSLEDCPIGGIYSVNMPASSLTSSEEDSSTPSSSSLISPSSSSSSSLEAAAATTSFASLGASFPLHLEDMSSGSYFCSDQSILTSRCNSPAHMQLLSQCPSSSAQSASLASSSSSLSSSSAAIYSDSVSSSSSNNVEAMQRNFYCHGNWQLNGVRYTVVSSSEDRRQYCLTYTQPETSDSQFNIGIYSGSCPHPMTSLSFASSSSSSSSSSSWNNQPQVRQQPVHSPSFNSPSLASSSSAFSQIASPMPPWTAVRLQDSSHHMDRMCRTARHSINSAFSLTPIIFISLICTFISSIVQISHTFCR